MHFFGPASFRYPEFRSLRLRWRLWLLRFLLDDGPWHCLLDWEGMLWTCSPGIGCRTLWAYPGRPTATFAIDPRRLDLRPWREQSRFAYWRSILDVLGFLPEKTRTMNCVQATAGALGIRVRLRTPLDLYNYLSAWSESWQIWESGPPC